MTPTTVPRRYICRGLGNSVLRRCPWRKRKQNDEELRCALAEFRIAHGFPQRFQRLEPRGSLDHTQAHAFRGAGDPPPRHHQPAVFTSMGRSDFSTDVEPSSFASPTLPAEADLLRSLEIRMINRRFPQYHPDRGWILGVALTGMLALIRSALRGFTRVICCSVPSASFLHAPRGIMQLPLAHSCL